VTRSIPLSGVIFCLASEDFENAFVAIRRDDFQPATSRQSGQYRRPFESGDFSLAAIVQWNIPLSQHEDHNPCRINTFSMLDYVFQVFRG
jgi:hypothetical protein